MDRLTKTEPSNNTECLLNFSFTGEDRRVKLRFYPDPMDLCEYISKHASQENDGCGISAVGVMDGGCIGCNLFECPLGALNFVATQAAELRSRLGMIEDILGDTYDLKNIFTAPCKPGDTIYWVLEDDGKYYVSVETVVEVGTMGFFVNELMDPFDGKHETDALFFYPWDEIGKTAFLTPKEAEAALAKMKEGNADGKR